MSDRPVVHNHVTTNPSGPGFVTLLQVALIVLKLTGLITCSWVLVFTPFLVVAAIIALVVVLLALVS